MFSYSMFEKFYEFNDDPNFSVDEEVKQAYFIFIKDFVSCVSPFWKKYLKTIRVRDAATFVNQITPSDEGYAIWYLTLNYEREHQVAVYSKTHSKPEIRQFEKENPKGLNQTLNHFDDYVNIFDKIEAHRVNANAFQYWQNIFFDQYLTSPTARSISRIGPSHGVSRRKIKVPKTMGTSFDDKNPSAAV